MLAAVVFGAIGTARALRALAILPGPDLPVWLFLSVAGEAVGALLAAFGLFLLRYRAACVGLAVFAVCAVAQMAGDVGFYGVRSLVDGLIGSLLAVALAGFGWIVLERTRGARPRDTSGPSSDSGTSPSRSWS